MIREATDTDFDAIWSIFHMVVSQGDAYVYSPLTSKERAYDIWMIKPKQTYVFLNEENEVLGTYYIKENRPDLGSHVCRCGFMVHPNARRLGIAEKMALHSFEMGRFFGFRSMQLGYVVSTNVASVNLWKKLGFEIIGSVPNAFQHQQFGDVDVYIMYKSLTN